MTAPIFASSINYLDFYPNPNPKSNPNPNPNSNSNPNPNSNPDLLRDKAAQLLNGGKGSDSTNTCILYKIVPKIVPKLSAQLGNWQSQEQYLHVP